MFIDQIWMKLCIISNEYNVQYFVIVLRQYC